MSATEPQSSSSSSSSSSTSQPALDSSRQDLIRHISIAAVIVCPALILLPPRKIDIYTVGLVGGTFFATNHLAQDYTGRSITTRMQDRMRQTADPALPPRAQEMQRRLREEKLQRQAIQQPPREGVLEVLRKEQEKEEGEEKKRERGLLQKIWMGGEGDDWKAKRDQREKEALESGEGYGGLIMAQFKEVFSFGKQEIEEVKEIDDKVVEERKAEKK